MKKHIMKLIKSENGNILVFVSFAFTGLLMLAGLVIDGGNLYATKSHLQKVANAAALSGAQGLAKNGEVNARQTVNEILGLHEEESSLIGEPDIQPTSVKVYLSKPVSLAFSKLLGKESVTISASATASIGAIGHAYGAAPLGIHEDIELEFYDPENPGEPYPLHVGSSNGTIGNYGILQLNRPGAPDYYRYLDEGFDQLLSIGDKLATETGVKAGTKSIIDNKVDSCSSVDEPNCSRILLVPVYKDSRYQNNKLIEVEVTGFAYFYIAERMSSSDTSIKGYYIRDVSSNKTFIGEGARDKGAYSIRLTE
ncbi:pilus assembly protein TadG-related protein [Evansella sp. AB-rgal1]|uniref:pilus assembly protein TadG-related protein n=1 Tax=Evansella sp. AB-rgal1 TaxID=3242696 RepID=UPI00359CED61